MPIEVKTYKEYLADRQLIHIAKQETTMPKGTILDRLAGAMKTLGKREGKALTPRQRVAAAQRWNSLADIGEDESTRLYDNWMNNKSVYDLPDEYIGRDEFKEFEAGLKKMGLEDRYAYRADNPFLSDNIYKYAEQSDFLDWCRYNRLEPNARNLKTFRWETYKGMSIPQREKIYRNYDPSFLPEERMWRSRSDMPDYLPVGWNKEWR